MSNKSISLDILIDEILQTLYPVEMHLSELFRRDILLSLKRKRAKFWQWIRQLLNEVKIVLN